MSIMRMLYKNVPSIPADGALYELWRWPGESMKVRMAKDTVNAVRNVGTTLLIG